MQLTCSHLENNRPHFGKSEISAQSLQDRKHSEKTFSHSLNSLFLWFWGFRETLTSEHCTCSHDKKLLHSLYTRQNSSVTCAVRTCNAFTTAHLHNPSAWTSVQRRRGNTSGLADHGLHGKTDLPHIGGIGVWHPRLRSQLPEAWTAFSGCTSVTNWYFTSPAPRGCCRGTPRVGSPMP